MLTTRDNQLGHAWLTLLIEASDEGTLSVAETARLGRIDDRRRKSPVLNEYRFSQAEFDDISRLHLVYLA